MEELVEVAADDVGPAGEEAPQRLFEVDRGSRRPAHLISGLSN